MIVGTLSIGGVDTHALFDYGATHSFVSQDKIGNGMFQMEWDLCFGIVNAVGGQAMHSLGLVKYIPVVIQGRSLPVDLVIIRLNNHKVILGMDGLVRYRATLDCHRGRVRFEGQTGPIAFQGIRPTLGSLVVSAIQAEWMLEKGCEAYLETISTTKVGKGVGLGEIPVVKEFEDAFQA